MLEPFGQTNEKNSRLRSEGASDERVASLLPLFSRFPEVRRVILFGSRARGDFEERSDIDLAVDAPSIDNVTWDEICLYITENSNTLLPIDLIWFQQATGQLANRIQNEGVSLFERENESIYRKSSTSTF